MADETCIVGRDAALSEISIAYENGRRPDLRGADLCVAILDGEDLRRAILDNADLCGAKLRGADLYGASLCRADLSGACLSGADLREASLQEAVLRGANLRGADLSEANLYRAALDRADLCRAVSRSTYGLEEVWIINFSSIPWPARISPERMQIGCEDHPHDAWRAFSDARIREMAGDDALQYWRIWKESLLEMCNAAALWLETVRATDV